MLKHLLVPAVLIVAGGAYALDHGVYIGTRTSAIPAGYETFYQKHCQYLFVNGIVEQNAIDGLRQMTNVARKEGLITPEPDTGTCRLFAYH